MFARPRGVDGGATRAGQAFDARGVVEEDRAVCDVFDHCPVVVIALQAEDDGAVGCAVKEVLHRFPKGGQVGVGHATP
mgnify:CR=1 FL=1